MTEPIKRRQRAIPFDKQLQAALNEAADACQKDCDPNLRVLIQRRCEILSHLLRTTEHGKLLQARARCKQLEAENASLREALAVARGGSPDAARLRRIVAQAGGTNASL
jgi:hypothetical protein